MSCYSGRVQLFLWKGEVVAAVWVISRGIGDIGEYGDGFYK